MNVFYSQKNTPNAVVSNTISSSFNDRLLRALHCRNNSRPPVWLMRQAGRHLASYRALRKKYSFLDMCHNPELIAEVTLLPIEAYQVDAAILFSDILVIPEALKVGVRFEDKVGPIIEKPITNLHDIEKLAMPEDLTSLEFVEEGIRCLQPRLNVPLIGFCGAPFTVASYMIEGKTSRDFKKIKHWMYHEPQGFHTLLRKIADWSIAYLNMQIDAGVHALQIFDSWANTLSYRQFQEFSLNYLKYILKGLKKDVPLILFCRGSSVFGPDLASINPAAVGLDWNCRVKRMRDVIPYPIALQGNLDPDLLYAPLPKIREEVNALLDEMEGDRGFILNLGHGIFPDVSEEAVRTLVESVRERRG
ncbi:uroporphyrinogen decarboxylase [Candidatus Protochlamydia amoebophila]|uniref:uroporphyrinogen decarboxylase n=1 Tax=Candidatus Protochlamydia amoebophila TaxID=362787 RepID=UPI002015FC98|nr:uroporphyrinogen decarboxylase [Candidatus Protochlamydia amoebophila]